MKRRDFSSSLALGTAAVFAAEAGSGGAPAAAAQQSPAMPHIVDTNLSLFHWPFRRLPLDELPPLVQKMRSLGIQQAWAGSFEGLLHRDLSAVNRRLAATCKQFPELLAIGSVNPQLPDWQTDLRQCVEQHRMPGIRLHPNYHGYTLEDPQFERLLQLAGESNCLVQLAVAMEDTRTQHPMLQVPDVDLTPLPRLLQENPRLRLQVLNWRPHPALLA
ncbi:MAG: hypothetical protein KDA45_03305, partial [Planctomycetales bacterium]|nr:hypothetical protein [Planctomycetales bacterium]